MHFGLYLVRKGTIGAEQFVAALECHLDDRVPLGQLAIEHGLLTRRQLFEILRAQSDLPLDRFGDVAVQLGFMTKKDVAELLIIQSDGRRPLADILVELGFLNQQDLQAELAAFRRYRERAGKKGISMGMPASQRQMPASV